MPLAFHVGVLFTFSHRIRRFCWNCISRLVSSIAARATVKSSQFPDWEELFKIYKNECENQQKDRKNMPNAKSICKISDCSILF